MLEKFKDHISINFPELRDKPFLLACSGGVDSVVLAHLCHDAELDFAIAHCNFQLRGQESDADASFVEDLALKLNKRLYLKCFNTIAYVNSNKVSVQIGARQLRYQWFAELMEENRIKTLVTAHQADDNLETFLINLSRGTGIDGLSGIPEKTDTISRPLLIFTRAEILDYAQTKNLKWREDSSNSDTKYLRNKIRHEVVPKLKELHPNFEANFKNTQRYLLETAVLSERYARQIRENLFVHTQGSLQVRIAPLLKLTPQKTHIYALFKDFGFTEWNDVADLLTAMSGKEIRSKTHRLIKDREYLLLTEIQKEEAKVFQIHKETKELQAPVHLRINPVQTVKKTEKNVLYVAKETLKYPLTLRKWEKGDYFYPLGLGGRKKLSKFFKDEKMDILSKERQWLLCSGDAIVWVLGRRADDRFKVVDNAREILKFELNE